MSDDAHPPIELEAEAAKTPGGWVYEIVGDFGEDEAVPPSAIRRAWKVDDEGRLTGEHEDNPNFVDSQLVLPSSWPHRYRVVVHTRAGAKVPFYVLTWLGESKAIAMVVEAHLHRQSESGTDATAVYDVAITDLGPAAREDSGAVRVPHGDLTDRFEF